MARMARVVVAGMAHHVTQRGNRRQRTFFRKDDYRAYVELMAEWCGQCGVGVWAYCLMPNHVHLIVVPETEEGLRRAIGEAYLLACARYVERNPVRAGLCARAGDYPWSSAAAHLAGKDDGLVRVRPLLELVPRWGRHLSADPDEETVRRLRRHEGTGRPLGGERFLQRLEKIVGRLLRPRRPGRKKKNRGE